MPIFTRQPPVLQTAYSEVKRVAQQQPLLLTGTPGSLDVREVKGRPFYYRQFYDAEGSKASAYIGPVGQPEAEERAMAVRRAIELAQLFAKDVRLLAQAGYVRADKRTVAILASLANHAVFAAGALLIGSNAYGALLNELGVKAAAFATEDVDIARTQPLRAELLRVADADFEQILAESTVRLAPVPGFGRTPSTSYAALSGNKLSVDLLVPSGGDEVTVKRVPELKAHAQAMPHLRHLLVEPIDAVVLGHNGVVPVRVPRPEAYAWHKVRLSQMPGRPIDKRRKDAAQAAVLLGVLAEDAPDALGESFGTLSPTGKSKTRSAVKYIIEQLRADGHARAAEIVDGTTVP
jgi:hypothetical protein